MTNLITKLKAAKAGDRIAVPKSIFSLSFAHIFNRGNVSDRCDHFELAPPLGGTGFTGSMWHLFGYQNKECLLVTALFADPIDALNKGVFDNAASP